MSEAQTQLASAEGQLAGARAAQAKYSAAYASVVSLGKAVPASQEVPSLIFQLSQASNQKHVEFNSIASTTTTSSAGGASTPASTAAAAGFTQMPFTFIFNGGFFALEHLFQQLNGFTVRSASGDLLVSGRLLTVQSVKLAPLTTGGTGSSKGAGQQLSGTITATAYVLPAGQSLTGGATSSSPVSSSPASASPASSSAAGASPSTPATTPRGGSSGSPASSSAAPAVAQVTQ